MAGAGPTPRLFSIPAGAPFLAVLAESLLAGRILPGYPDRSDPLSLADLRIYVPTRRAARALAGEFARQQGGQAALLPQILPLGALAENEEAGFFETAASGALAHSGVAEAIPELDRRLLLTDLVLKWGKTIRNAIVSVDREGSIVQHDSERFSVVRAPGQAFALARELGALIDEMTIEGVDWRSLGDLAPDRFDQYWSITLEFLKIVSEQWPAFLATEGLIDEARRYALLAAAEAERLTSQIPLEPTIVAGSTGTNAATAQLMRAIAGLPMGAVVLPGLDRFLDEKSWRAVAEPASEDAGGHHQAALARLLARMECSRADVVDLASPASSLETRMRFVGEALRPAASAHEWTAYRTANPAAAVAEALSGIVFVDADNERLEALAIAVAMRQCLERPGATAALATPDRNLARRVQSELARWGVSVDDSAGSVLADRPAGVLATLLLALAMEPGDCAAAIGLLNQPGIRLGLDREECERLARLAEILAMRGVAWRVDQPAAAMEQARALAGDFRAHPARRGISDADWSATAAFLQSLAQALAPLLEGPATRGVADWFAAHRATHAAVVATPGPGEPVSDDGEALEQLFDRFAAARSSDMKLTLSEYATLFESAAREAPVRAPQRNHPRLAILGLLEARLIPADVKILAGLDETVWPPAPDAGAFLNRPMRATLGLTPPERRIGQTAHDFIEAMGAETAILTRAKKRGDAPAIPSRFVQRMMALAGDAWSGCRARGDALLDLARRLDTPGSASPVRRPEPRPALDLRPASISVTGVETWRRDPYAIYAQQILRLQKLDPPGREFTNADTGSALHAVLDGYQRTVRQSETQDEALARIHALAREAFADRLAEADFRHFLWPRLCDALREFVAWDRKRRQSAHVLAEISGRWEFALADGTSFTLRARADRIEILPDGQVAVVDYKSGRMPSPRELNAGFSPQLTLEAAIVENGGFAGIPAGSAAVAAIYVKLLGAETFEPREVGGGKSGKTFEQLKDEHLRGFMALANQFRNPATPYIPRPFPQFQKVYNDYDHLARVKEWLADPGGDGE